MPNILVSEPHAEVLIEIGQRLRRYRLTQNVTAASAAARAGLNRNTVLNAESGKNPRLDTIVRLLRVYGRLDALDAFLPPPPVSPPERPATPGRTRLRARPRT